MANAVSSFYVDTNIASFRIRGLDFANLSAAVTKEVIRDERGRTRKEIGGRDSRETLKYGPLRPGRAVSRVIRLASSMTKDRVTSECADNLHTRPLQLRLRRRRESHRSLTMPSGRRIKLGLWHVTRKLQHRIMKIFTIWFERETALFALNCPTYSFKEK